MIKLEITGLGLASTVQQLLVQGLTYLYHFVDVVEVVLSIKIIENKFEGIRKVLVVVDKVKNNYELKIKEL